MKGRDIHVTSIQHIEFRKHEKPDPKQQLVGRTLWAIYLFYQKKYIRTLWLQLPAVEVSANIFVHFPSLVEVWNRHAHRYFWAPTMKLELDCVQSFLRADGGIVCIFHGFHVVCWCRRRNGGKHRGKVDNLSEIYIFLQYFFYEASWQPSNKELLVRAIACSVIDNVTFRHSRNRLRRMQKVNPRCMRYSNCFNQSSGAWHTLSPVWICVSLLSKQA